LQKKDTIQKIIVFLCIQIIGDFFACLHTRTSVANDLLVLRESEALTQSESEVKRHIEKAFY